VSLIKILRDDVIFSKLQLNYLFIAIIPFYSFNVFGHNETIVKYVCFGRSRVSFLLIKSLKNTLSLSQECGVSISVDYLLTSHLLILLYGLHQGTDSVEMNESTPIFRTVVQ
jgi:hypothetical protein